MSDRLASFLQRNALSNHYLDFANQHFLPVAETLYQKFQQQPEQPLLVGINGCQGSGKSTLADYLCTVLIDNCKVNAVTLSLDDFYLSKQQRQHLAERIHPLLKTRGVPGTHDTRLLNTVLQNVKSRTTGYKIPRFNKADDEPLPEQQWQQVTKAVDILIFEGWCWGVYPEHSDALLTPINNLEATADADGIWRSYVNQQLNDHYCPLYHNFAFWLMLKAPDFATVYQWRLQQEQKLAAKMANGTTTALMNEQAIYDFIQYFQRLTEHCLASLPSKVDQLFQLDGQRYIIE